jgi:hypothetical protein
MLSIAVGTASAEPVSKPDSQLVFEVSAARCRKQYVTTFGRAQ